VCLILYGLPEVWWFILVLAVVVRDKAEWPAIGQPHELWVLGFTCFPGSHFCIEVAQTRHLWLITVFSKPQKSWEKTLWLQQGRDAVVLR
jgi:hypothetical protein